MGKSGSQNLANGRLWISIHIMMFLVSLWPGPARCQECRIQRCNAVRGLHVALRWPAAGGGAGGGCGGPGGVLRRPARLLPLHPPHRPRLPRRPGLPLRRLPREGALLPAQLLQRGAHASPSRAGGPHGPRYPAGGPPAPRPAPALRLRAAGPGRPGPPVSYAHCALFGDPHLRTFRDEVQTCRAEGAWPSSITATCPCR
ncbi:hypothetical protein ANANG_G00130890 [Anguilla anguilla]|uniref:Repulsive guidance molecule C-terminal domain-containing protein n=1 Tax=Anguilla anguilla TaxID=7936 RepID=A0A9D3MHX3_ANGAN|nr:hypothetical protein ANANG_G00130890 [Anguilla anguilla]